MVAILIVTILSVVVALAAVVVATCAIWRCDELNDELLLVKREVNRLTLVRREPVLRVKT